MSPIPPEAVGAVPQTQAQNPQDQQSRIKQLNDHGLSKEQIDGFRKDPEIIQAVKMLTGRDFPMEQIDDVLMVQIAGMVHKLGVQGAVQEANRVLTPEMKATIRGIAMKQGIQRVPQQDPGQPMPPQQAVASARG